MRLISEKLKSEKKNVKLNRDDLYKINNWGCRFYEERENCEGTLETNSYGLEGLFNSHQANRHQEFLFDEKPSFPTCTQQACLADV